MVMIIDRYHNYLKSHLNTTLENTMHWVIYKRQTLISHSYGSWMCKIMLRSDSGSGKDTLSDPQMVSSHCVLPVKRTPLMTLKGPQLLNYYVSIWKAESQREISHSLSHSWKACNNQGWARPKPGAKNSIPVFLDWVVRSQILEPSPTASQVVFC